MRILLDANIWVSGAISRKMRDRLKILIGRADIIKSESVVELCRDSHDDYLLALCQDGKVDYFITGDKDLLVHNSFGNTRIIMLTEFEEILRQ